MQTQAQEKEILWNQVLLITLRIAEKAGYNLDSTSFMYSPDVRFGKVKIKDYEVTQDSNGDDVIEVPIANYVLFNHTMFDGIKDSSKLSCNIIQTRNEPEFKENEGLFKFAKMLSTKI